jgi:acid phosphatase type 7
MSIRLLIAVASACACLSHLAARASADPVVAAAGDIACDTKSAFFNDGIGTEGHCRQMKTSNLLVGGGFSAVLPLGDTQYHVGSLDDFEESYDPSWGRVKAITRPEIGNHEYGTAGAGGYFDYFNGRGRETGPAGDRDKGYYSFDVGNWHLVALNTNCARIAQGSAANGCAAGSPQERWLRSDLATHRNSCTLAYWHEPLFNSGLRGNSPASQAFWQVLYEAGADVVLSADAHSYERFAPQAPNGTADPARGLREFVVGTGGAFFTSWSTLKPNSEVRQNTTFGVLALTLHPGSYDWRFLPEAGKTFTDAGSGACHGRTPGFGASTPPASKPAGRARCTIRGTGGNDRLLGTSKKDVICGLGGNDTIRGRGGNDVLRGGAGKDRIYGGKGRDRLYGDAGNDILRGQSGNDRVVGGRGRDRLYGDLGRDSLSSRDNRRREWVFGGRGRDVAKVDRGDRVRLVERVFRR